MIGARAVRSAGRRGFTLAELVMAIAILAVAGVLLAQVFIAADRTAARAEDLDRAVAACTTMLEDWKASGDAADPGGVPALKGARIVPTASGYLALGYLDTRMEPVDAASAAYRFEFSLERSADLREDPHGTLFLAEVAIRRVGDRLPVYSVEAARYAAEGEGG